MCGLTACSGDGVNSGKNGSKGDYSAMGRYMEEDIKLPDVTKGEYSIGMFKNQEGNIESYYMLSQQGNPVITKYTLNGQNWSKEIPDWSNYGFKENIETLELIMGEDGKLYGFVGSSDNNSFIHTLYCLDKGGKALNITPKTWGINFENPIVLKNGNIVYLDPIDGSIYLYSIDNGEASKLNVKLNSGFIGFNNQIIGSNESGDKIIFFNTESKATDREVEFKRENENGMVESNLSLVMEKDKTLYCIDTSGIHRMGKENTMWETIIEGSLNMMAMSSASINCMIVMPGEMEEYYVSYMKSGQGNYNLKHYVYDETISSVPKKQINIYSLQENSTVRQVIPLFHQKNPDVRVNYIVAGGEDAGITLADNIKILNTELLSGKGADILLLDGLPIDSYIDKGVLEDLGEWLAPLQQSGELLENILESYKRDKVLYGVPIRYNVPLAYGIEGIGRKADSLSSLSDYSKEFTDIPLFSSKYDNFLKMFLYVYYEELLDDTGNLSKDRLVAFLETSAAMKEDEANKTGKSQNNGDNDIIEIYYNMSNFSRGIFDGNTYDVINKKAGLAFYQIGEFADMMIPTLIKKHIAGEIADINGRFIPKGIVGISNGSKEKQLAGAFLTFLLSEEIQEMNFHDGFPVNAKALEKWTMEDQDNATISMLYSASAEDNKLVDLELVYPNLESRRKTVDLIKCLYKPVPNGQVIIDIILNESEGFMKGEMKADAVADAVLKKVKIYLAEQN